MMTPTEVYIQIFNREPCHEGGGVASDSCNQHSVRVDSDGQITVMIDGIRHHGRDIVELSKRVSDILAAHERYARFFKFAGGD